MQSRTQPPRRLASLLAVLLLGFVRLLAGQTQATTVPLILPGGLAYDASGDLYFAETGKHIVRRVTPAGVIATVAGDGVQGLAGDGGPATAAELDSPAAVALDAVGNLFIADTHNHRIRRVDAVSGVITTFAGASAGQMDLPSALAFDAGGNLFFADQRTHLVRRIDHASGAITTVAGNGTQGFAGDGGLATLAALDSPSGLALDAAGDIFLADTHNQRVRRVDAATGIITTIAGPALSLPRGLAMDGTGNLFVVDSRNQRILRIDAATGQIATIAGDGTQQFAGDGTPAVTASLDTPRAVTISPANLPTLADTGNERVRQVDAAAVIHTIAGLGVTTAGDLTLTGPSVTRYGTGSLTATLVASAATGSVTFFDAGATLGTAPLAGNVATFATSLLAAGAHSFSATYPGDTLHAAAQSGVLAMTIAPAPLLAAPNAVLLQYGQAIPPLTGTLTGVLAQDGSAVGLALATTAAQLSPPGTYPITASLSGTAAGNYTLTATPAAVTIAQAPATVTLSNALAVHVASSTAGLPSGSVSLYDGATLYAAAALSGTGDAQFSAANLSVGTHTLIAKYGGDANFLAASSGPLIETISSAATVDFSLAATGQTAVTVPGGTAAAFSFAVNPLNGALSSPLLLTASGLPMGATASFNPAYLPPSNTPAAFLLTIQTPKTAGLMKREPWTWALLPPLVLLLGKRRRVMVASLLALTLGCGDRINNSASTASGVSYNITVTATATSAAGATLQHTAVVTLTVQ